jgi:hypothetical protein
MEKSISKAFTFMFKDSDWKYKLFVLAALAFPGMFLGYQSETLKTTIKGMAATSDNLFSIAVFYLLILIFIIACTFIFEGYCCKCTQKIIYANGQTSENDVLPKWEDEFWEYSKIGVSFSIGVGFLGLAVALGSILIIPLLFYIVGYVALKTLFCVDFKMGSFFAWKKALRLMNSNFSHYFSVILCSLGIYIAFGLVAYLCSTSLVLVFLGAFAQAYVYLVLAYLRGTLFTAPPEVFFEAD